MEAGIEESEGIRAGAGAHFTEVHVGATHAFESWSRKEAITPDALLQQMEAVQIQADLLLLPQQPCESRGPARLVGRRSTDHPSRVQCVSTSYA